MSIAVIESEGNLSSDFGKVCIVSSIHYQYSVIEKCSFSMNDSVLELRHRKMSVWHHLISIYTQTWENVFFGTIDSVSGFRHQKLSETWGQSAFRPKRLYPVTFLHDCFYPSVLSVNSLQGCFSLYLKYENQCFLTNSSKSIPFLFYLLLGGIYSLLFGVLVFIYCRMDCGQKTHDGCFLMWRRFCSFNWFTVWLVKLLHFTGHLLRCKFPAEACRCLLVSQMHFRS